ncbi:hypothetical protein C8E08_2380 [Paracidovorax citrulli]|nr:hypothetical protein C8E08_2380 [Paracidovorax citrulli]QCX10927.1 hypothetical protein APS58_2091 [Paracidovorax citrulli]REG70780.1 hypothetical protein C8E07_3994 [Paracidovorax citrulli]RLJ95332.1 hypothetical protein C8E06_3989 [Paracidovorax citrulli]
MMAVQSPMAAFGGCEFATFRLLPSVDAARITEAAARMRDGFLRRQHGFLAHALLQGDGGLWADMVFAATRADAERICAAFMDHAVCRDYLALMEPGSAHLGFWSRAA